MPQFATAGMALYGLRGLGKFLQCPHSVLSDFCRENLPEVEGRNNWNGNNRGYRGGRGRGGGDFEPVHLRGKGWGGRGAPGGRADRAGGSCFNLE